VRTATASGKVLLSKEVLALISNGSTPKGDVLATARIAGIMGAKKTAELIPLCHPISISNVNVDLEVVGDGISILSTVKIADRTGVEMEALTAVSVAALTIIDMVKALDPGATISQVRIEEKDGGRNGHWKRS
jgi:cyclic pyranopterin monophosphate synthase